MATPGDEAGEAGKNQAAESAAERVEDARDAGAGAGGNNDGNDNNNGNNGNNGNDGNDGDAEPQAATGEPEGLTVEERLQAALEEVDKHKDVALRAEAEMQNMRRRTARDVENAHKYGLERFLQNLLPVIDGIEKSVEAVGGETGGEAGGDDAIAEGVRLCRKLLMDVMSKEGIEVVDPVGEPFDPNAHQAMSIVENPDMEPNSVFAVVQKGYKLNGRLVRPAMVMVTRAPDAAEEGAGTAGEEQNAAGEN